MTALPAALLPALALTLGGAACETTVNLGNGPDAAFLPDATADAGLDATNDTGGADGVSDTNPVADTAGDTNPPPDAADAGPKGIFITRATYTPDWGGVAGANFRCQASANAAQLGGTWKAWMSDTSHDAANEFTSDGPWIAVISGITLFQNKANLRGFPLAQIKTDELGQPAANQWWTGTLANGVKAPDTCQDWSTKSQFPGGQTGGRKSQTGVPGKEWTEDVAYSCQSTFALLCLQD